MKKNGFTLIEVSAVIAILSTLSIGAYHAVQKGKSTQCLNNLKQIYQSVSMFAMDHGTVPDAKFFPSSQTDPKGIPHILAQYGARGGVLFCPSIPPQLNTYGTNYIWNDTLNNKHLDSVPSTTWLMTEMTAVSKNIPAPHTGGFNILFAGGNAQTGQRVSFPSVPPPQAKQPVQDEKPAGKPEPVSFGTFPKLHIRAPHEVTAGEEFKISVSMSGTSGETVSMGGSSLEITAEDVSAEVPSTLEIQEGKPEVDFNAVLYKAGITTVKAADTKTNLDAVKEIQVIPGKTFSLEFLNFPAIWEAGIPQKVTVVSYDRWKNNSGYTGEFFMADKDLQMASHSFSMEKGFWSEEVLLTKAVEKNAVYATVGNIVNFSPEFSVVHSKPQMLEIQAKPEAAAGSPCEIATEVKDMFGNRCREYSGYIELILPEGTVVESEKFVLTKADQGRKSFNLTFFSSGNKKIKINAGSEIQAEKELFVTHGTLKEYTIREIGPQEAGKPFDIIVKASDNWGNQVKGFYLKDPAGAVEYVNRDFAAGLWIETVLITKSGEHTIHLEDSFGIKGISNSFFVKPSSPEKIKTEGLPLLMEKKGEYTGKVLFIDAFGNEIPEYKGDILINSSEGLKTLLIPEKTPAQILIEPQSAGCHNIEVQDRKTGFKTKEIFFALPKD